MIFISPSSLSRLSAHMAGKISSPGAGKRETWAAAAWPRGPWTTRRTTPWVSAERSLSWTSGTRQTTHTTSQARRTGPTQETVSYFCNFHSSIFTLTILRRDGLQAGRCVMAREERAGVQLWGDWGGHLPHEDQRAGPVRGVRPPPRPLHLHHVLLLHEEGYPAEPEGLRTLPSVLWALNIWISGITFKKLFNLQRLDRQLFFHFQS